MRPNTAVMRNGDACKTKGRAVARTAFGKLGLKPVALPGRLLRGRDQTFALRALARQLAGAAHGFRLLASALFRRLFIMDVPLHFAERALALHLLLQRLQGLVDVVVADKNLNQRTLSCYPFPLGLSRGRAAANGQMLGARRRQPSG